jgi:F-type H+-transporting ATPase subunit epsilon
MTDTNAGTFSFELVSPERKLISEPAAMVVVPGTEGDFGVLPNHSALVSSIRPGVLSVFRGSRNDEPVRIFVAGGFADVSATNLTVLAEEAVNVNDLNAADLEQTIRNLTEDLGMAASDVEKARINHRLFLTRAKLEAVTGHIAA